MSSTSFEPEGSSSEKRLYSRLPEAESSGSKLVQDNKKLTIEVLVYKRRLLLVCIVQLHS